KDFLAGARQSIKDERQCYDSNRQVYVENPPPRESINQKAAQKRPGDAAERENPGKQPLIATAFTRGDEIGDCYLSERHQTTGAEALQCAKPNYLHHGMGEPTEGRTDQEDNNRNHE